jgi:molybdate transport repressor ModE-like protein
MLYEDIRGQRQKFEAAFISLTGAQRKLVTWVFLDDPERSIAQAARELGVSYFQAVRMLKKALKIMREVITRMESNKTNSGGKNEMTPHPSAVTAASPETLLQSG